MQLTLMGNLPCKSFFLHLLPSAPLLLCLKAEPFDVGFVANVSLDVQVVGRFRGPFSRNQIFVCYRRERQSS